VTGLRSVTFERQLDSSFQNLPFSTNAILATDYGLHLVGCSAWCAQELGCRAFFFGEERRICTIVRAATRPLFKSDQLYVIAQGKYQAD